jgi:uncharacterized protein with von Willebrand factor type A (vWA) domain
MLIDFFLHLKARKLPVSTKEFLTLLEALQAGLGGHSMEDFYFLSRSTLVKDESLFDRFDQAFGEYFKGIEQIPGLEVDLPAEWLKAMMQKHLSPEERAKLEKLGWDKLMEEFKKRLAEQKAATRAAASGSAPAAPRPSATAATTRKASAWAANRPATARPSRCGTSANTATWTTPSSSAPATSRWPCAGCAALRGRARRTSSTWTAPSPPPPATPAGST